MRNLVNHPGKLLARYTGKRLVGERGQSLAIFALSIMVMCGAVAMSIDVGRYVWARTQMQAAVDASALAAAQSMPNQPDAELHANEYWLDNSGFIQSQGTNVQYEVTYPPGNKAIRVAASADIPTYFAKFFGVDHWDVSAEGDAESQVLDISVVLDISGSMCFDSYPNVESGTAWMGPGNPTIHLTQPIPASTDSTLWIHVDDASIFDSGSSYFNRSTFGYNSSTPYWDRSIGGRKGMLKIGTELFQILEDDYYVDTQNDRLFVRRARQNKNTGAWTTPQAHPAGSEVWANRTGWQSSPPGNSGCIYAAPSESDGPYQPYDGMNSAATYFTTLFDSDYDKIGLAEYSSSSAIEENLSSNFASVRAAIDGMTPPGGGTNIAHGLAVGRQILDGTGKRANAVRVLVLLTDGMPTNYCGSSSYNPSSYDSTSCSSNGGSAGAYHALAEAERAADVDIIIFTIGLGNGVDESFLEEIADIGGGAYYASPTTAELDDAFESIAEQTHIALVR